MVSKNVAILGFDGVNTLDLSGPLETLAIARRAVEQTAGMKDYNLMVIALEGTTFTSQSGVVTRTQKTVNNAPPLDTIVIPGGAGFRDPLRLQNASKWIANRTGSVRRIVCVSEGIYPVAIAGLLDNRCVTTHWRIAQDVAQRFPALQVNYAASFLKDGAFYTSGSGSAAIEMTLALIQEDHGTQLALSVARELGVELRPPGADDALPNPSDYQCGPMDRLAELPAWIVGHLREKLSRQVLAERTGLCERHFARLFKRIFHLTPADFVEHVRLSEARRRLLLPRNSVDSVAASVGFTSGASFRRAFDRRFGVSPRAFRARFTFAVQDVDHEPGNLQTVVTPYKAVRLK